MPGVGAMQIDPCGSTPLGSARAASVLGDSEETAAVYTAFPIEIEIAQKKNSCAGLLPTCVLTPVQ